MVETTVTKGDLTQVKADAVVVNLFEGVRRPGGATGAVDQALGGAIAELVKLKEFKGKEGETTVLLTHGKIVAPRVILVGLGKRKGFDLDRVRNASAKAAQVARDRGYRRIATVLHGAGVGGIVAAQAAQALAEGVHLGLFELKEYKSKKTDPEEQEEMDKELVACIVVERDAKKLAKVRQGLAVGVALAEATNLTRRLIIMPSIDKPPAEMARIAKREGEKAGLKVTVFDHKKIEELGMGLLRGVGSGAGPGREPRFVILEHKGRGKKTVALIGKGITFDTGGINIKPSKGLEQMKYDMAGSATVLGAILAAARLKAPNRVIAIMALAENMPSGTAIRPGDVLSAYDGTQVEVGNTDAEGRLVLGDAIAYAVKHYEPDVILDAATLTGAVKVALGDITTGVLGNDDALIRRLIAMGKRTGEDLWQLPLHAGYEKQIKSHVADIQNIGPGVGGTITAAAFLKHFVGKKAKWAHLDIAGTCWTDKGTGELRKDYLPKGATGVAVRLFVEYLRQLK